MLTRTCCAATVASLLLLGCGGGGGGNGDPGGSGSTSGGGSTAGFVIVDAGTEPRITLNAGTSRQALLAIQAEATESIDLDGSVSDDRVSANLELASTLSGNDSGGAELRLIPVLSTYSELSDVDGVVVPGAWQRSYDANGVLIDASTTDPAGLTALQSLGVFLIPALMLSAPDVPLGVGASWTSESPLDAGVVQTTTRLLEVREDGVQVETTSEFVPADESVSATQRTVVTAAYDRDSLLIRSGEVQSTATFAGTVSRNGIETPVSRTRTLQHLFSEVQP